MSTDQVLSIVLPTGADGSKVRTIVVAPTERADEIRRVLRATADTFTVLEVSDGAVKGCSGSVIRASWTECDGVMVRSGQRSEVGNESVMIEDVREWAAPELEIVTSTTGTAAVRQRLRLPTEEGASIIIGRLESHADFVVDDEHMSRGHLRFTVRDQQVLVADADSKWGSIINGHPLLGEVRLKHRDVIGCGKTRVVFYCYYDELESDGLSRTIVSSPSVVDPEELESEDQGWSSASDTTSDPEMDSGVRSRVVSRTDAQKPARQRRFDQVLVVICVIVLAILLYLGITNSLDTKGGDEGQAPSREELIDGE